MTASQSRIARSRLLGSVIEPVKVSTSSGEWYGEALRSKIRGVIPRSSRRSTTWETMKPPPPVTRTLISVPSLRQSRLAALRSVVERDAPVVLSDPVGVRQLVGAAHDPVAGLV